MSVRSTSDPEKNVRTHQHQTSNAQDTIDSSIFISADKPGGAFFEKVSWLFLSVFFGVKPSAGYRFCGIINRPKGSSFWSFVSGIGRILYVSMGALACKETIIWSNLKSGTDRFRSLVNRKWWKNYVQDAVIYRKYFRNYACELVNKIKIQLNGILMAPRDRNPVIAA